ncbi:MAG TPA: PIN domain-containing protein [Luteolibacter sp.]|nr:PIN domain-containing protein [Luteolibacter sp.]
MDRLFFDTNVLLDVLEERAPWFPESAACLALARKGSCVGALSAISLSDIAYIQRKTDSDTIYDVFTRLLEFLEIAPLDDTGVRKAIGRRLPDIEDGFQLESAVHWQASHLITRNTKDFPSDRPLAVVSPADYLEMREN